MPRPNTVCCAGVNHGLGRISSLEVQVYEGLLEEMMREIDVLPYRKAPALTVCLKAGFETVLHRIGLRGRDKEALRAAGRRVWLRGR